MKTRAFQALNINAADGKKIIDQLKAEAKKLPILSKDGMTKLASHTQKFVAVAEKEGYANIEQLQKERADVSRISAKCMETAVNNVKTENKNRKSAKADTESESEYETEEDDDDESNASGY